MVVFLSDSDRPKKPRRPGVVYLPKYDPDEPRDDHGRWTDVGGSGGGGGESKPKPKPSESEALRQSAQTSGGFTYSLVHRNSPTEGYALSISKANERILKGQPSAQDIRRYITDHQDVLSSDDRAHIGGWYDPGTDQFYLDVSLVEPDLEKATALAKQHDQLAIYDLKKGETITMDQKKNQNPKTKSEGPPRVRFDFPPDATPEEIAAALAKLREKHRPKE